MSPILLTLRPPSHLGPPVDLELPAHVPLGVLGLALAKALGWPETEEGKPVVYTFQRQDSEATLRPENTLEQAEVLDGDVLIALGAPRRGVSLPPDFQLPEDVASGALVGEGGRIFNLKGNQTLIGRPSLKRGVPKEVLDIDLSELDPGGREHPSVSRPHARIVCRGSEYLIQDMNSTNGTWVNGERILPGDRHPLQHRNQIRLGDVELVFLIAG